MQTYKTATLRYGKLETGLLIPGCFALETDDGRSILFTESQVYARLAYDLGAKSIDPDASTAKEREYHSARAFQWLFARCGESFDIEHTYGEMFQE